MNKLLLLFFIPLFVGCQFGDDRKTISTTDLFDQFLEDYHEKNKVLFPFMAMREGDDRYNDQLSITISDSHRSKQRAFHQETLDYLNSIEEDSLTETQITSFQILKWNSEVALEELQYNTQYLPMNQFNSLPSMMARLGSGAGNQPFNNEEDYGNWARRLWEFIGWCDTAMVQMKKGMEEGVTLPRPIALKLIPQLEAISENQNTREHIFYTVVNQMPNSIPEDQRKLIVNAYDNLLELQLIPKLQELTTFMKEEYLPACRTTHGISAIAEGEDFYQLAAKKFTTTNLSPEDIYQLGLKEVARIETEMDSIKNLIGYEGDLRSFFDHIRNNKELMPYKSAEEVIAHFEQINHTIQPHLPKLFSRVPHSQFIIKRTEAFRENSSSPEYQRGLPDGSKPGTFYVPVPDATKHNVFSDECLFLHEAIPGHHYQSSLQMEDTILPAFRRNLWYSSYGEGWALYCESMGEELGLYKDPYQYFGMLSLEMHRAIRLVIDVAIHTKGMTREEAIAYSLAHEAESKETIIAEVERYISWPGQALSYKIGQLKILELRSKAEAALGEKFDIRAFHDEVLGSGCIPLAILEYRIDRWIIESQG